MYKIIGVGEVGISMLNEIYIENSEYRKSYNREVLMFPIICDTDERNVNRSIIESKIYLNPHNDIDEELENQLTPYLNQNLVMFIVGCIENEQTSELIARISTFIRLRNSITICIIKSPISIKENYNRNKHKQVIENIRESSNSLVVLNDSEFCDLFSDLMVSLKSFIPDDFNILSLGYADVNSFFRNAQNITMGFGIGKGENGFYDALYKAIEQSPSEPIELNYSNALIIMRLGNDKLIEGIDIKAIISSLESNMGSFFCMPVIDNNMQSDDVKILFLTAN